jgi:hypothetical protein
VLDRKISNKDWTHILFRCEPVLENTNLGDYLMTEAERALEELEEDKKGKKPKPTKKKK